MPQRPYRPRSKTQVAMEKTTINLPVDLKKRAQKAAIDRGVNLQDLLAEGLRLVLAPRERGA